MHNSQNKNNDGFDMNQARLDRREGERIRRWAETAMARVRRTWARAERQALAEDRERLIAEGRFTPPARKLKGARK